MVQATQGAVTNFNMGDTSGFVAVEDFNKDGKPDLAIPNSFSNNVSVLLNTTMPANYYLT